MIKLTEKIIQTRLYHDRFSRGERIVIPNCGTIFGWESDLLSVSKSGFSHDFEIKTSRADFLREFSRNSKPYRQNVLTNRAHVPHLDYKVPNYFWIAVADNVCTIDEIPEYAGLILVSGEDKGCQVKRKAPRLHSDKMDERDYQKATIALCYRFWNEVRKDI